MKALCICEKPSLMREIKNVYDRIGFEDDIDFIALHGHILQLYLPDDYDAKYSSWDKSLLPIFPDKWKYKPTDKKLLGEIKDKLKNGHYDYLINATDAEREGQNIFHSIYTHLNLKLPVKRIWLNDLNFVPIKDAIENMRDDLHEPFLVNLTQAAKCRTVSDWLVGMNFTRATGISIGRVKTPTLEILYKREMEIKNYVPSVCYYPQADLGFLANNDTEFKTQKECDDFIASDIVPNSSIKAKVLKYEAKEFKEYAPKMFSLGELQMAANNAFGYTLEQTLDIAQSLYEKKITTYPRTDCPYLTTEDAKRIPKMLDLLFEVVGAKFPLFTSTVPTRYVDDSKVQAHSAIILTGSKFDINKLTVEEKNVVKLIARRILATMLGPKITLKTKAELDINGNLFKANGSKLIDIGYAYLNVKKETVKDTSIDKLKVGDLLPINSVTSKEKKSTCPSRYNDASLIKAMINIGNTLSDHEKEILKGVGDQGGIGTPATRSGIVEGLIDSKWVIRNKNKSFEVTEPGMKIGAALCNYSFASASLTASWEEKLSEIVDGTYPATVYYNEMKKYVAEQTSELLKQNINVRNTKGDKKMETVCKCPKCGKDIIETQKGFSCQGYFDKDCDFGLTKNAFGAKKITAKDMKDLCEKKSTKPLQMHSQRTGKDFVAKIVLDEEGQTTLSFDTTSATTSKVSAKCNCGGNFTKKTGKFGDYFECDKCNARVSNTFCGKKFSDSDMQKLLDHKKVKGKFHSKAKDKDFEAKAFLNADYKFEFDFSK